ncbi:MAG: class I SAM-dependent methyltransferase [Chitinophagaceae bacterium]|nr:class I SAM-dependent methyltransferase [Chitinophagaceae bacterium]
MERYKKIIYENYISNHNKNLYGENSIERISAYGPALNHYYGRHLPSDKSARILDIGCGDGNLVYHMQKSGYKNASGVDVSEEQINKGRSMGISNLYHADLLTFLSENTTEYDFIIAKDVIEHFTRDEVFVILPLICKNLKPGGRFLMQVPNGQGLFYTSIYYGDFTHEMAYTESSIRQVMLNTGFTSVQCFPTGPIPVGIFSRIRTILWKIMVWRLKFWKMVETGNPNGIFTQNIIGIAQK